MKRIKPIIKPIISVIPKIKNVTEKSIYRLSEKTLEKSQIANSFFIDVANVCLFLVRFLKESFSLRQEYREFFYQCFKIGYKSLPLISVTGGIMGLVLTIQSRPVLVDFGAESMLPAMVAVSLIREIGPVVTGLICAGKIASGMGAELGSMKVTEQIDSLEIMGVNSASYLILPKIIAVVMMFPLLYIFSVFFGLIGGMIVGPAVGAVTVTDYLNGIQYLFNP